MPQPHLITREDDYWRLRAFLREIFLLAGRRNLAWHVQRLDYWRWHVLENVHGLPLAGLLALWEEDGRILAAMTCEDPGEAWFHLHPGVASPAMLAGMLDYAEQHFSRLQPDGARTLTLWAHAGDRARHALYAASGYARGDWPEHQWARVLDAPPPPPPPPPAGYRLRALGDESELPARSWVSWRAFHPNEPDSAYEGWAWYRSIQRMPLYRRDFDLVAQADDGTIAAFCTIWYDDVTRSGYFEPVGVDPAHQRRGLGRGLLREGIRRLHTLGATLALVSGYSAEANALYGSVMGGAPTLYERWQRTWG